MCMDDSLWILSEVGSIKNKIFDFFYLQSRALKILMGKYLVSTLRLKYNKALNFLIYNFFFEKAGRYCQKETET